MRLGRLWVSGKMKEWKMGGIHTGGQERKERKRTWLGYRFFFPWRKRETSSVRMCYTVISFLFLSLGDRTGQDRSYLGPRGSILETLEGKKDTPISAMNSIPSINKT